MWAELPAGTPLADVPLGRRLALWALWSLAPLAAAAWIGAITLPGGTFDPWEPAMIDLDVYRRTGALLLQGQDFYAAEGLPWIYPPFAALFTVPLALAMPDAADLAWIVLTVTLLMAMLHRFGLVGWRLALVATATVWLVEPVRETLAFGQLAVLLVSAAVLDSMPGPSFFRRRVLPEGVLVGLATAVKLTPATIAAAAFFAGRRRAGLVAFATFCGASALGFALTWQGSLHYWGSLLSGDSGINSGIEFKTNQSVMGMWARLTGDLSGAGLAASALVAVMGVTVAVLLERAGQRPLGLVVAGLTSLLASPISWSHHYVWVVPLVAVLVRHVELPLALRVHGLFYAVWVAHAPFSALPGGDRVELTYSPGHQLVDNLGIVLGLVFVGWCGVLGWRARRRPSVPATAVTRRDSPGEAPA